MDDTKQVSVDVELLQEVFGVISSLGEALGSSGVGLRVLAVELEETLEGHYQTLHSEDLKTARS